MIPNNLVSQTSLVLNTYLEYSQKHLLRMEPPYGICNATNERLWVQHFQANYSSMVLIDLATTFN
jgi:hypothetical protein